MRHQQTQSLPDEVRWRLRGLGLSPRKALGQHFLVSSQVLESILEAAELDPQDVVVEVGPGLGMVTRELAHRVARVVAVELDGELAAALAQDLRSVGNVQVLHADAREVEPRKLLGGDIPYKVVANLPYYAANPILRRFLEAPWKPSLLVVMVQREVAQSMAASPGRMSLLAVSVQFYGRPRIVAYVPPRAFYPPPQVTSVVVRIDLSPQPALEVEDTTAFFHLVRAGFSAPRKQLRNALSLGLGMSAEGAARLLEQAAIDPRRRAESLALEEWGRLYRVWRG